MLKRFLPYYRPHRKLMILDLVCAFLVGLSDEFLPLIVRQMINQYVPEQNWTMMMRWSIALVFIYIIKLVLNMIIAYWGHIVGVRMQADMRQKIFRHIESLPVSFFDDHKTGAIMSRITSDLQEISEMAHHGPEDLFMALVMLTVSSVMLGRINVKLTLIVYICLPISYFFVLTLRKGQLAAFTASRAKIAEINGEIETSIAGVRVTKAYDGTQQEYEKFDRANEKYKTARSKAYLYMAMFHSGMTFINDVMYIVVILIGGQMYFHGALNAGDFVAYLLYISMFLNPIKKLVQTYEQIAEGMSGFQRYEEIMNLKPEEDAESAIEVGRLKGDLEFKDVSFHYRNNDVDGRKVINHLNLHVPSGHSLGLAGPSGGGKTTICNLIPRFYEIDSGSITIDGVDIRNMTRSSLRKNIGIVAQDVFLFHGTVAENIAYGKPDATMEEIMEAARKAEIHEDILNMPDGYDTNVGERGVHLSGGQRQRISIARVFLKNPQILILDEATSALDNATEQQIQKSLDELSRGRTVLIVAHRLSTIRHCDSIAVVSGSGILEMGTSSELMDQKGVYYTYMQSSIN